MDNEATSLKRERALRAVGLRLEHSFESPGDLVKRLFLIQWVGSGPEILHLQ